MKKRTFLKTSSIIMAGSSLHSLIPPWQEDIGTNWAGNLHYSAKKLHRPQSVEEAQEIISQANKINTLGTRHSFSNIADCPEELLSTGAFNKVVKLDPKSMTVTVEAGIRYGELAIYLEENGFALHNLASLPHISVGGACATATHGSGDKNGNLASIVKAMEIIKADGNTVQLSDGDPDFSAAVVHLGALGVITKLTLAIQPTYQVQQEIFEHLPLDAAVEHFNDIFGSGYSVSFFTDWSKEEINQVWIKRRIDSKGKLPSLSEFYGASPATKNMHPIASVSAENCTDQMSVPGAWHERLPHFKLDFTPSNGEELQSEFFVPRSEAPNALLAIQSLNSQITPLLFISEVRSIAADDFWMSTAEGGDRIAFHFTWKPDWEGVQKVLPLLEKKLEPFSARPHWGKLFHMQAQEINDRYPKVEDFKSLARRYDPEGKFRNAFLTRNIFGAM
ncbi:MAG: FAD-binding protein [Saprospiraceae bacterium]|nr:FAD-binding protein [Saprospiraceae bacterium]